MARKKGRKINKQRNEGTHTSPKNKQTNKAIRQFLINLVGELWCPFSHKATALCGSWPTGF